MLYFKNLKEIFKKFINYILDINLLITLLTFLVFTISFFGSKGIISEIIYLNREKKIIRNNINKIDNNISILKIKIKLLKEKNKEITEIENYNFKKKIPYEVYEIIKV